MNMKFAFLLFAILSILYSCDEVVYYDFFVKNNCKEAITVSIIDYRDVETNRTIPAKEQLLVYSSDGLNKLTVEKVESVFSYFVVAQGNDTSSQNYVDRTKWELQVISDTQANCYLTIDTIDF